MIFTIDFDNTCACEDFPYVGETIPYSVDTLKEIQANGHEIILWTCRQNESLERAVEWFNENDIKLSGINEYTPQQLNGELAKTYGVPRKVIGDFNVDDKNVGCPLIQFKSNNGNTYSCVDWYKIRNGLKSIGVI